MHKQFFFKRYAALLLALLITALLAGCGSVGEEGATRQPLPGTTQAQSTAAAQGVSQPADASAHRATGVSQAQPSSARDGQATAAEKTTAAVTDGAKPPLTAAAPARQETVALAVTCHNAVANGIREWPGYSAVIPENGVIFEDKAVAFTTGETVMDVLKRTLKGQKIALSEKRGYVRSINGLNEKLRGEESFPQSGWLYRVNDEFPKVASDQYRLKAGDRVEWVYTCKPGDTE